MSSLGVHFAITTAQVFRLRLRPLPSLRVAYVQEQLEEELFDGPLAVESDKAWDAIHRCLGDGSLNPRGGSSPLNQVILGGTQLLAGSSYIMSLKSPRVVKAVAAVLPSVSRSFLAQKYEQIVERGYEGPHGNDDFEYTWEWFS